MSGMPGVGFFRFQRSTFVRERSVRFVSLDIAGSAGTSMPVKHRQDEAAGCFAIFLAYYIPVVHS
ncbi:hypothetical protein [Methylobacterium sp. Leaf93]|uniref:hypothetical protein n=1 Tax=Methylobacterium sp. Leaf93 TaxID=1736249 RepID=UPI0012E7D828|nr:hypothetical protein [Methylobacterium sp. Leaf93]